jgi:SAM-dependent methyltransferase
MGLVLVGDPDEFKAFEAEGWSAQAGSYDRLMGRVTDRVAETLLDLAGVGEGDRVLDVATGTGAVAAAAVARGAQVTGVDISEEMLRVARERVPAARFLAADAEELDLDEGFDAVLAGFLVNHLPRPERAVRAWAALLAPGGRLAFSLWERPERNRFFGLIGDAIGDLANDAVPDGPDPYRFADRAALEQLLRSAGLDEAQTRALEFEQRVDSADELWDGVRGGSVRSAARIAAQPESERKRMRADLERLCERHREGGALSVPVAVALGAASRSLV